MPLLKKHQALALACLLAIPVITLLGGALTVAIDPEIARGHPDYARNFRLIESARMLLMLLTLLADVGLWLLTCHFLLKAKRRSSAWLILAPLGPLALAVLTALPDGDPAAWDRCQAFLRRLGWPLRIALELLIFAAIWFAAFVAVELKREAAIILRASATGMTREQIIQEMDASSGMWAFSEGLELLFFAALCYLCWPIVFNLAGRALDRLARRGASPTR